MFTFRYRNINVFIIEFCLRHHRRCYTLRYIFLITLLIKKKMNFYIYPQGFQARYCGVPSGANKDLLELIVKFSGILKAHC